MQRKQASILFIIVTAFLDILGIGIVIPVLPELVTQLSGGDISTGAVTFGYILSLFALMQFVSDPILGAISDQVGRRPILLFSLVGIGLDYLVLATATTLPVLIVGRVIAGLTGSSLVVSNSYIADVSTMEDRARNFGLLGATFGIGFVMGPVIGGLLATFGLRVPFFVALGLTVANFIYGYFILPESLPPENRTPVEWRKANPFSALLRLQRYPVVLSLAGVLALVGLAEQGLRSVWVLYTTYKFGWDELANGLALALIGLLAAAVQGGLIQRLVTRFGEWPLVLAGLTISAISYLLYGLATGTLFMVIVIIFGALGSVSSPATQSIVTQTVSPKEQGAVQGALGSLTSLTAIIAPIVATGLFGYFTSPAAPVHLPGISFYVGALLLTFALIAAWRIYRQTNRQLDVDKREAQLSG